MKDKFDASLLETELDIEEFNLLPDANLDTMSIDIAPEDEPINLYPDDDEDEEPLDLPLDLSVDNELDDLDVLPDEEPVDVVDVIPDEEPVDVEVLPDEEPIDIEVPDEEPEDYMFDLPDDGLDDFDLHADAEFDYDDVYVEPEIDPTDVDDYELDFPDNEDEFDDVCLDLSFGVECDPDIPDTYPPSDIPIEDPLDVPLENEQITSNRLPLLKTESEDIEEDLKLSQKDKKVIYAFTNKEAAESRKLLSDGKTLEGLWMGGRDLAFWKDGKIHIATPSGRASQTVANAVRKIAANIDLADGIITAASLVNEQRDMDERKLIANTILKQMGGMGRIKAMTGAKNFSITELGVQFQFPNRQRSRGNAVRIDLNGKDLYDVSFYNGSRLVKEYKDIYFDQLMDIFEEQTGLYLTLGRREDIAANLIDSIIDGEDPEKIAERLRGK